MLKTADKKEIQSLINNTVIEAIEQAVSPIIKSEIGGLRNEMNARFDQVEGRLKDVEMRLTDVEDRLDGFEGEMKIVRKQQNLRISNLEEVLSNG